MKSNKNGFTLIELLVVIAIIGILAGIVLVSLRGATTSARNARIQSGLVQIRNIAAMIFDRDNTHATLCSAGTLNEANAAFPEIATIERDLTTQYGGTVNNVCFSDAANFCVSVKLLPAASPDHFCIMSDGRSGRATSACTSVTAGCAGL